MTTARTHASYWPDTISRALARFTRAETGANYLAAFLFLSYVAGPLAIGSQVELPEHFYKLASIAAAAALGVWIASYVRFFDPLFDGRTPRLHLSLNAFLVCLWLAFTAFVFVAWATADQIPLLAALTGADANAIAVLREQFLKAREGWQATFVYINAILSGALIPYSIALMFQHGHRFRWIAFSFFLLFCVSFVEKAFFLKAVLPLLYLAAQQRIRLQIRPSTLLWAAMSLLVLVTVASGVGNSDASASSESEFFSVGYTPENPLQHLVWRTFAIPLLTAADAIRVHDEQFGGTNLWGATSSFLAALFGIERIDFERLVFAAQWGQNETGTGSSNSVFFTEGFVNFGWLGAIIFALIVGLAMRLFARSRDEAFRAMWLLFALGAYTSGLIGLLLSNGFALLFFLALFISFETSSAFRS